MPTKRMWLGHAPDIPQIDQVEFDETSATVVAEGTDLIFAVNGKELLVENPHPLEDDDAAETGDTSGILTLLQAAEAAINGSTIPEIAELEASVETPDADPDSPYHRLFVTTREQFHGWPFTLSVSAPNPTIDVDYVQKGAPGQNEKQSWYTTPAASGGTYKVNWNLGSGLETSGAIAFDAAADDVKAAMILGMASLTVDNLLVTGAGTESDPFVAELTDDLAETNVAKLSIDVSLLTGNGTVTISTTQQGGGVTGGSSYMNDTFTDTDGVAITAHSADSGETWTQSFASGTEVIKVLSNEARLAHPGSGTLHQQALYHSDNANADFQATVNVKWSAIGSSGNNQAGFVFRRDSGEDCLLAVLGRNVGKLYLHILKRESGVLTLLNTGTVDHVVGTTYTLTLTVSGSSITLSSPLDSITYNSSFNQTDAHHGIYAAVQNTGDVVTLDTLDFKTVTAINEKWSIYTNGAGGTFSVDNPDSSNPQTLSSAATTAQVKSALETLYAGSTFTVTGGGTPADPWLAEDNTATNLTEPTGDGTDLTGGFDAIVAELQDGSPPLDTIWDVFIHNTTSGNLTFEFLGRPTANIAYGATGATVLTALQNLAPGDFSTGIWTVVDTGIGTADYRITAGGRYSGALQTLTAHNESLVGTALGITHTTIQQPTGRNWIDNPANYRDIATGLTGLPETGDELFLQIGDEPHSMRFGSLAGVELVRLVKSQLFRGHIGLPEINAGGYVEYRDTHITLEFQAGSQSFENPNVLIGVEQGQGSGLVRIRTLSGDEVHIRVERTGGPVEEGRPSFCWDGQNANSTLQVIEGFVGVAVFAGISANLAHVVQRGGLLRFGELTAIGSGGFDRTAGETFGRASIGGSPVVFGA